MIVANSKILSAWSPETLLDDCIPEGSSPDGGRASRREENNRIPRNREDVDAVLPLHPAFSSNSSVSCSIPEKSESNGIDRSEGGGGGGVAPQGATNRFSFSGDSERQIEIHEELVANFEQGFPRPFQEPIDGRAVDQGWVLA